MAIPLRIEFEGAVYHVTSMGNERNDIFREDHDRRSFLFHYSQVSKILKREKAKVKT
ncbi:MAG: hypothetical protein Fur0020_14250 [Thermodesulfovibrionia bacterium]